MKNNHKILLEKATNDLKAIENLLKLPDSPCEIIAFHIQQMVEKLLKAFLISKNINYKPTHDLFLLLETAENIDSSFKEYYNLAEDLSPYAVLVRYEEGFYINLEEVQILFSKALELKEKIIPKIT